MNFDLADLDVLLALAGLNNLHCCGRYDQSIAVGAV
jgi:hypothetical protein